MEIKILSEKSNPSLKRKEIEFRIDHTDKGSTPTRLEVRSAIAGALKINVDSLFVKKFETKPGMRTAYGTANIYDSVDQAKVIEPEYIVKRNLPPEKPKEGEKEDKK